MSTSEDSWEVPHDWWKGAFDELYLQTDARSVCDPRVTGVEVEILCRLVGPWDGGRVLDLCGGQGRHSRELSCRGFEDIILLDYSWPLLKMAALEGDDHSPAPVRGDARSLPFRSASFDLVLLLGNSFGLFPREEENSFVLEEVARILKPGGRFFLDILDPGYLKKNFRPRSIHRSPDGMTIVRERVVEASLVRARETVLGGGEEILRVNHYSFKLYEQARMEEILTAAGLGEIIFRRGFSGLVSEADCGFMESRQLIEATRKGKAP